MSRITNSFKQIQHGNTNNLTLLTNNVKGLQSSKKSIKLIEYLGVN